MAINSYIKNLTLYPQGASVTVGGITSTVNYTDGGYSGIAISNSVLTAKDGTGLNQLWQYRTQFEATPKAEEETTSLSTLAPYYMSNITNTSLIGKPYKFSQFKGAETFYVQFVSGKAETQANRVSRYKCAWNRLDHCFKELWCLAQKAFSELGSGANCYVFNYRNDANITLRIRGGYGSTGKFVISLTNPSMGTVSGPSSVTEGTDITYNITRASNSGQGGFNVGEYIFTATDAITGQKHVVDVFVPYAPYGTEFYLRNRLTKQTFVAGTTPIAGINNSIWVPASRVPGAPPTAPAAAIIDTISPLESTTCSTATTAQFFAKIFSDIQDIQYTFQYRIPPTTTWTNVGAPTILTAATLTTDQAVSAQLVTSTLAISGEWQLRLSAVSIVELAGDSFNFYSPVVDINHLADAPVVVTTSSYTVAHNITADSCMNATLSVLRWDSDKTTNFTANATAIPTGYAIAATSNHTGGLTPTTFTHTATIASPGTYTFLVIGKNTVSPHTTKIWPSEFYFPADPTLGIAELMMFNVVTVP